MHIHDFHSKFVSEEGHLFEALRSLSQVESAEVVFDGTTDSEWLTWPPMDAHASNAALTGV